MTDDTAEIQTETVEAPKHSATLLEIAAALAHETEEALVDALRHIESAAATLADAGR